MSEKLPRVGPPLFSELVAMMNDGDDDKDIAEQLREVVRACEETGKKGQVSIKINIAPGAKMVGLAFEIKTTKPRPSLQPAHFFSDQAGGLHKENPRQQNLGFDGPKIVTTKTDPEN